MTPEETREAKVETITAALLMLLFAVFLLSNVGDSLVMTLAGVVLLGSGIYQTTRGWHVSLVTWLLGLVFLLGGIGVRVFLVAWLQINWVAIALAAIGLWLLVTNLRRRP